MTDKQDIVNTLDLLQIKMDSIREILNEMDNEVIDLRDQLE